MFSSNFRFFVITCSLLTLIACGGGSGGSANNDTSTSTVTVHGSGIKGILANATVSIYKLDTAFPSSYDMNFPLSTGNTDPVGNFAALEIPSNISTPLVLVVDGTNSIDLNSGQKPVISELKSIFMLSDAIAGKDIFATPYTTIAYEVTESRKTDGISSAGFMDSFSTSINDVSNALGLSTTENIDYLSTPAVLSNSTNTIEEQQAILSHRASIEAIAAIVMHLKSASNNTLSAREVILRLAEDLTNDGEINGDTGLDITSIPSDIDALHIPGTQIEIGNTQLILEMERQYTGTTVNLNQNLTLSLSSPTLDADRSNSTGNDTGADDNTNQNDLNNDTIPSENDSDTNNITTTNTSNGNNTTNNNTITSGSGSSNQNNNSINYFSSENSIDWNDVVSNSSGNRYVVNSQSEFNSISSLAQPGDVILISGGNYQWSSLNIPSNGTEDNPIIYTSENENSVTFRNVNRLFNITGSYNIVGGFNIEDISDETFRLRGASNNRITDNTLKNVGTSGGGVGHIEISRRSNSNRFDHNIIENQVRQIRILLDIDAVNNGPSQNNRFDRNVFKNSSNSPKSVIQIGQGPQFYPGSNLLNANTLFEHNLIENYYQNGSLIQVKSSGNTIRFNEIKNSNGGLYQRQGTHNKWHNNYIHGSGKGIAIEFHGSNNQVYKNVVDVTGKLGFYMTRTGERPSQGTINGVVNAIPPTHDNVITNNYILNYGQTNGFSSAYGMYIGLRSSEAWDPLHDNEISNNFIRGNIGIVARYEEGDYSSFDFDQNNYNNTFDGNTYIAQGTAQIGSAINYDLQPKTESPQIPSNIGQLTLDNLL